MSTRTRKRPDPDPAQLAAMAAARYIKKYLWTLCDEKGNNLGAGTINGTARGLSFHLVDPIRRALRRKPAKKARRKGAKR